MPGWLDFLDSETPVFQHSRRQTECSDLPYKTVLNPDGSLFLQCYRVNGSVLIRFPMIADFHYNTISHHIECYRDPDADDEAVLHLFLNQVVPLSKSMQGRLVLHASSVEINNSAVLFLGKSGAGKSSLATYFALQHHELVCEDGAVLSEQRSGFQVDPGHHSIRLWGDSRDALVRPDPEHAEMQAGHGKLRLSNPSGIKFAEQPRTVSAIFHIQEAESEAISLVSLSPRDALSSSLEHMFLLDDRNKSVLSQHFDQLSGLSNRMPHFAIAYPRQYERLPDVLEAIVQHCPVARAED